MSAFVLLAMIQTASVPTPAQSPGEAAAAIFREGCVQGALRLSSSRGRFLKNNEIPDFADIFQWGRQTTIQRVIKFSYPRSTYLAFADYKNVQPKSIVRVCALISAAMSKKQAAAVFLEGLPDKQILPVWWPNMYFPRWIADHPELGFRKSLRFRDDGSIVLQVGMYASAVKDYSNPDLKRQ